MWAAATRTFISILVEHPFGTILWGARRWGFLTPLVEIRRHSIVRRKWCLSFGLHLNSLPPPPAPPCPRRLLIFNSITFRRSGTNIWKPAYAQFSPHFRVRSLLLIGRASFKWMSAGSFSRTVELRANSPFGGYIPWKVHAHARSRGSRRLPEQPLVINEKESS